MTSILCSNPFVISNETKRNQKQQIISIYRDCEFNLAPSIDAKKTCEEWKQWQSERLDIATLCRWKSGRFNGERGRWTTERYVQFAVLTGAKPWSQIPGIVVMDADDAEAMQLAEARCPKTPLRTSTPGGGMHYFYRHPGFHVPQILKHHHRGKTFNLDRKADGNYVMTPGTISLKSGGMYCASLPWTPDVLQSLPIFDPSWIIDQRPVRSALPPEARPLISHALEIVKAKPAALRRELARGWLQRQPGAKQGEQADSYCFGVAVRLVWGFGLDHEDAVELLEQWGQRDDQLDEHGQWYPWKWSECNHKIKGATTVDYKYPGDLFVAEIKAIELELLEKEMSPQHTGTSKD